MKVSKAIRSIALAMVILLTPALACANIKEPKGFDHKVYASTFALYGSSGSTQDRFLCTVTAYEKVQDGYLLIGAGHCTGANPDLPPDLTFKVSTDLGTDKVPVALLKSAMEEPLDYAVYFMPSTVKYPTIAMGNESQDRIGDRTVDVNFSLDAAKQVASGVIASTVISAAGQHDDLSGFFLVTQMDSHGASGSSVVSEKTRKIIGLVIAGWDGATMPSIVEPISKVEKELGDIPALLYKARQVPIPVTVVTPITQDPNNGEDLMVAQRGGRGGSHGNPGRGDGGRAGNPGRGNGGRGDGRILGRDDHRRVDRNRDVRVRGGRQEIYWHGFWFGYGNEWPVWVFTDEIYMELIGDDTFILCNYADPNEFVIVYVVE
jgi:hypothetical protein